MKNKGFTLVELLVAIVVLGIVMGLAFPVVRQTQLQNEKKKYETYAEGLMTSARIYVDSYDEDMFGHHDTGCAYVTYQQLLERDLIKDVPIANRSCNSGQTFVRVVKLKDQYGYSYSLGCGDKEEDKVKEVDLLLPEEIVHEMDTSVCRGREGAIIDVSAKVDDNFSRRKKTNVKLESATGIHGSIDIYVTWIKGERKPNDEDDWQRINFEVPGNQEETILGGDIITVESEDVVSPAGDGDYYLWIRVEELKDMFGEEWKNPNEEDGNYVHAGPFHLDNTAPVCTYSGEVEENAWSTGSRTITIGCQDTGEGASGCKTDPKEKTFTESIGKGEMTYEISDKAGNKTTCSRNDLNVYIDNTKPACYYIGESTTWTIEDRTIILSCKDNHSGCEKENYGSQTYTVTTETATASSYTIQDNVGNSRTCPEKTVNVYVGKQFRVTFNHQGATAAGSTSVVAAYGVPMPAITKPTRAYTVAYNYNGGSGSPASIVANYPFGGYYTETDGKGVQYYNGNGGSAKNWNKTVDTTLYAKWNTGSVTLPTPTRTGHTFAGWYTAATGGSKVGNAGASYVPTKNTTLYARWTPNTYTVSYVGNGNTGGSTAASTCTYGRTFTPRANGFTKTGHVFNGWSGSTTCSGNMRMTATWAPGNYYAFGVPTLSSTTNYASLGKKSFLRLTYPNTYSVCVVHNGLKCIQAGNFGAAISQLYNAFGAACYFYESIYVCHISNFSPWTPSTYVSCFAGNSGLVGCHTFEGNIATHCMASGLIGRMPAINVPGANLNIPAMDILHGHCDIQWIQ